MDIKERLKKISQKSHKYRYALLVVIIGLIMMMLPEIKRTEQNAINTVHTTTQSNKSLEDTLSQILSKIQGAGDVYVMLTVTQGEEIIYQTDQDTSTGTDSYSKKCDTVTVTDAGRNEIGLIRQTIPAKYMGAIIVCSGADDPVIKLAIVDAVSKVTGIGANKISVLKTK